MLNDNQLNRYADVLLWGLATARKERFRKGDIVLIQYDPPAIRLTEVLFGKILAMGLNPVQRMGFTFPMEQTFYRQGTRKQLTFIPPGDRELYENINGRIFLRAPDSLTHLKDSDPDKIATVLISRKPLRDILDGREDEGVYSWTLCTLPTSELARQAGLSLKEYTAQVIRACYLDMEDPVREWDKVHDHAARIRKWLNHLPVKELHIESPGTDLRITVGKERKWLGISGHNIPSFEIFLSPDWRGTRGTYYANLPSFRTGNYVEGVRLLFEKGRAVTVKAKKGEDFARKQLAMDRGACQVGEFSLTDRRFSKIDRFMADTLFDENFGGSFGNCHLAVGASYSDTFRGDPRTLTKEAKKELGFNDSALHWDLINTEQKRVTAHLDGGGREVMYEDGMFCGP